MEQRLSELKNQKVQHILAYQKLQNGESDSQNFFGLAKKYDKSSEF
jgi:hypothetical protein